MRLQLNLPALERLIAGDSQMEVELRHQVVENFAKHHLKKLMNDDMFARIKEWFRTACEAAYAKELGQVVQSFWCDNFELESHMREHVARAARAEVDAVVKEHLAKYKEDLLRRDAAHIEAVIQRTLDRELEAQVEAEVRRRLDVAKNLK